MRSSTTKYILESPGLMYISMTMPFVFPIGMRLKAMAVIFRDRWKAPQKTNFSATLIYEFRYTHGWPWPAIYRRRIYATENAVGSKGQNTLGVEHRLSA